ncbi:MAG: PilZ domain-containing protein [Methylomonas sp.]
MLKEKRGYRRVKANGLQAGVVFNTRTQEISLDAEIIDISYSGIRVRLKNPIVDEISGPIKINMLLPDSQTPFSVHGILKHQHNELDCGVHYVNHVEGSIDDLMFECIGLDETTVLIKPL